MLLESGLLCPHWDHMAMASRAVSVITRNQRNCRNSGPQNKHWGESPCTCRCFTTTCSLPPFLSDCLTQMSLSQLTQQPLSCRGPVGTNLKGTQNYKLTSLQSFLFLSMLEVSHIHLQERRETKRVSPKFWGTSMLFMSFPGGASRKDCLPMLGLQKTRFLISGWGRSPGGGHGNPF